MKIGWNLVMPPPINGRTGLLLIMATYRLKKWIILGLDQPRSRDIDIIVLYTFRPDKYLKSE
jgi:hypothetical protein